MLLCVSGVIEMFTNATDISNTQVRHRMDASDQLYEGPRTHPVRKKQFTCRHLSEYSSSSRVFHVQGVDGHVTSCLSVRCYSGEIGVDDYIYS